MRKLWLIARREFVERGKTGAYIVSVLFMMLVLLASTVLPAYLTQKDKSAGLNLVLLDRTGRVAGPLQEALAAQAKAAPDTPAVKVQLAAGDELPLVEQARSGKTALLIVEGTFPADVHARYLSGSIGMLGNAGAVLGPLENLVRAARLQQRGIDTAVAGEILRPLAVEAKHLSATTGERDSDQFQQSLLTVMGFVMLIYLVLLMTGSFVFQGVLEEKISRVIEVMASSVTPTEMLSGKILGLGGLGLTQFLGLGLSWAAGSVWAGRISSMPPEPPTLKVIGLALLLLALGYLLFASLMAGAAATLSRMEDSQTLLMPMTMIIALPMFFIGEVIQSPDGTLAVIFSMIPFFAPIIMLVRVMLGDVPGWQLALSILLLLVTTYGCVRAGARVFRAALLVHGSRPSIKQLWSYLRAG